MLIDVIDCTLAYNLLNRLPDGLKQVLSVYEEYVRDLGKGIVSKLGSSTTKVRNIKPLTTGSSFVYLVYT